MGRKGSRLCLFFLYWPGREYSLPGFREKLLSARLVDGGRRVRAVQEEHRIILKDMPREAPDVCTVVELAFDAPPTTTPWSQFRLHGYPYPPLADWART
jgi:hypothetical protein